VISVPARDGGGWRWVRTALPGLATATLLAWALHPAAAVGGLMVAALCWQRAGRVDVPELRHDKTGWSLDGAPMAAPAIVLDTGGWMLLALTDARWVAVSPAGAGAAWPALRAALYSSASPQDGPAPGRQT
jgi:hypothetical protein